ncbi:MAG TPA: Rieske 2Fe-2S domain-containing protein [Pedobacter sp.]|uniref:QcrA and Rieske domain-containing protein n=1 Tax=Pedobacter sp. TaxID=1411316 RepID=UPI002C73436D|nr:Rieske 2Fe-2S domain-containing protein [Pedobacter sp.]HMI04176.1 Rieske 2Fe-2S domain-containing protein [Pedobacter sp.]
MERDEFLKSLGLGLALVCTGSCMSGCGKGSDGPEKPPTNPPPGGGGGGGGNTAVVDLATQLKAIGDQATVSGVLFFRIAAGDVPGSFVATESVCPHQAGNLVWKQAANRVECQLHFSQYSTSGTILQQPQGTTGNTRALKIYSTAVNAGKLTATIA